MSLALSTPGRLHAASAQRLLLPVLEVLAIVAVTLLLAHLAPWTEKWPSGWVIPAKQWITDFFSWLGKEASLGLFTIRDLTRFIAWLLSLPLGFVEGLLY